VGTLKKEVLMSSGSFKVDYVAYNEYLNEVQAELLKIASTKCNHLHDQSQLSAVIFLLLRATSLFRSLLSLLSAGPLDAYDPVRRAYLETWLLAFEFRLEGLQSKTAAWHAGKPKSWSPNIGILQKYAQSEGIAELMLGKDYGGLSEAAHPTKCAAGNSVAVITAPHGELVARTSLLEAKANFEGRDVPEMMYRFLWLTVEERAGLIRIDVNTSALPTVVRFAREYAMERLKQEPSKKDHES
jgi:hypothetical protein